MALSDEERQNIRNLKARSDAQDRQAAELRLHLDLVERAAGEKKPRRKRKRKK